jgi:hypothetical protein
VTVASFDTLDEVRHRLREDTPFYAQQCIWIIDKSKRRVRLEPKAEQLRFDAALEAQRADGKPMRAIILKARQIGFSTWTQAKLIQRVTQNENHDALVVAHDMSTAKKLFNMGHTMWRNLPQHPQLAIKPRISNRRIGRELHFGNPSRLEADAGDVGLNSSYAVGTAKEVQAGRGGTLSELHGSEVAFWDDIEGKLTGLLESVPDDPETLVVLESTAKGFNEFKDRWDDAWEGRSEYLPFFSPWFEEPSYTRPFVDEWERERFLKTFGLEAIGEDEPTLREQFHLTDEQLNWRRWKILSSFGGKGSKFKQEYPATPQEAFIATGSKVFEPTLVARLVKTTETTDPRVPSKGHPGPKVGTFKVTKTAMKRGRHGMVEVPTKFEWVPRGYAPLDGDSVWRVWEEPEEKGQYVASMDPSDDEETDRGENAWTAIQIINHKTLKQAAEYRTREPMALAKIQLYVAALHWNQAFVVVERTGGYGTGALNTIYHDFKYPRPRVYFRRAVGDARERESDRLGWSTNRETKPDLIETGETLLLEGTHGIRSRLLAGEFTTYVKLPNGRTQPEKNAFADLLMSWLIGQKIAYEVKPRSDRVPGSGTVSMLSDSVKSRWMLNR